MLIAVGVAISSFGILANDIMLNVQQLGAFAGITEFNNFDCLCEQDPSDVLPGEEPTFSMDNCDLDEFLPSPPNPPMTPNPGFIGSLGAMVCSWETHVSEYGAALTDKYWEGEGCDAQFWEANQFSADPFAWPSGSDPNSLYNDIFSTNLTIQRVLVTSGQVITEEELLPMRGRVTSAGVLVGSATFAREPSSQTQDFVDMVALNAVNITDGDSNPTLIKMLTLPDIVSDDDDFKINELVRHSTAALLNARHLYVNYYLDEVTIIALTQKAIEDVNYGSQIEGFKYYNGLHENTICPKL